ncbi:glycosyl transferase family 11 [Stylonychia lemnae]|uniref:Glycosyl transferase family 11 n=1 Tax=Stylonychia lemnae TaxID=5949 RepID=A0A078B6X3_STYLE|nr:glycosyl transferase family 11 [Stylonychia lemnae]|eukprot:CDW90134.1 glycosyl transferase family 11 [Stylonychia lemnae]
MNQEIHIIIEQDEQKNDSFILNQFDLKHDQLNFTSFVEVYSELENYNLQTVENSNEVAQFSSQCLQEIRSMFGSDQTIQKSLNYIRLSKRITKNKIENLVPIAIILTFSKSNSDNDIKRSKFNDPVPINYYVKAMEFISKNISTSNGKLMPMFYVFSENFEIAKNIFNNMANVYIIKSQNLSEVQQLQLMIKCQHFILSNNSLDWWAAFLSKNPGKIVIQPWYFPIKVHGQEQITTISQIFKTLNTQESWYSLNQFSINESPMIIKDQQNKEREQQPYQIYESQKVKEQINLDSFEVQIDQKSAIKTLIRQQHDKNIILKKTNLNEKQNQTNNGILVLSRFKKDGIGNQLFSYTAGFVLAQKLGYDFYLVDEVLDLKRERNFNEDSRDFMLNQFDLVYSKIISEKQAKQILSQGYETIGAKNYKDFFNNQTLPHSKNINLIGYFLNTQYFKNNPEQVKAMIRSDANLNKSNEYRIWKQQILKTMGVAVHFRIGDLANYYDNENRVISLTYQIRAMHFVADKIKEYSQEPPVFYIFSDDYNLVSKVFKNTENVVIVSNGTLKSVEELFLMMSCKHFILPTTSFSWWPAFASDYKHKIVVASEFDWPHQYDFENFQKPQSYPKMRDKTNFEMDRQSGWYVINQFVISFKPPSQIK